MSKPNSAIFPIWMEPSYNNKLQEEFIREFNIHPVTAQVLISRGMKSVKEVHDFLYSKLPNLLDPELFPQMPSAVNRIYQAMQNNETVLVFGDNDVDGITGTTLLTEFLRYVGLKVYFFVANRNSITGSPIVDALNYAIKNQCSLMITVDCGITAVDEIRQIHDKNIDVIITDHHEPTDVLPHCVATLNPKLINSTYPNRDLTGVGVAFKLAHAYTKFLISNGIINPDEIDLKRYLDLVALGTIADMGSLINENRILVRYGLMQLHKTKRIGLAKLMKVCGIKISEATPADIASKLAPRLNSLGRISDPMKGVELLLIQDAPQAEELAKELDLKNIERQQIEKKDSLEIEQLIQTDEEILKNKAIVISSKNWHPAIIPIITARIAKQHNRPTIIITIDSGIGKASIRTIPEFPILKILKQNSHLLLNYGGHDYAAGLSIKEENIEEFKKAFIEAANAELKDQDITPKLNLDAKVNFDDITFEFLDSLSLLEPYGNENPYPVFYCEVKQVWPPKVIGKTHLKLYLEHNERFLEGIAFGLSFKKPLLTKKNLKLEIAFTPHVNNYLNKTSIQLQIKDFKILEK